MVVQCLFFFCTLQTLPHHCFTGYEEILGSHRETLNDTCQICKPGYFNNDPSSHSCKKCRGGVICLEGEVLFFGCICLYLKLINSLLTESVTCI